MDRLYFVFVALLCIFGFVKARFISNSVSSGVFKKEKGWIFLDRMAFDAGKISFTLNAKLITPKQSNRVEFKTYLHIIPDYQWAQQIAFKCDRQSKVITVADIQKNDKIVTPSKDGIIQFPAGLLKSQGFQLQISSQFQINQPTTYNFVFKDCNKHIIEQPWRRQTKIEFSLQTKNGDLEYGSDEKWHSMLLPLLIIATFIMMYFSNKPDRQAFTVQKRDLASIAVFVTLICNFISIIFYWVGHLIYTSVNGKFYAFFDFMYLLFHSLSQSLLTILILFVAYGWTISYVQNAEFDLYLPLGAMLGIINLILTLLGKITDGTPEKYHMYDTIPSYMLVFFRIVTVGIMSYGVVRQYLQNSKNQKLRDFYVRFGILGVVYFFSLPVIMILAQAFPAEQRKIFVFITVQLVKNGINALMTWMVCSKKSKYSDAKLVNRSFMQSENKLL